MGKKPLTNLFWADVFGWVGICLIILAYALISFAYISPTDFWYPALNGAGSLGVLYVSYVRKVWQPVILNVFWLLISAVALMNVWHNFV